MKIQSKRLLLLPISESDAEPLLGIFRDPAVRRYLLDDTLVSLDWVREEIASSNKRFAAHGGGLCAIRLLGASAIIGFVGFREFFVPPRLQLLYGLLPDRWSQGLACEAARRMCEHAFQELGFSRIEAAMDAPNTRSIALAERLGFCRLSAPQQCPDATVFYEIDSDTWNIRHPATARSNNSVNADRLFR